MSAPVVEPIHLALNFVDVACGVDYGDASQDGDEVTCAICRQHAPAFVAWLAAERRR